MNISTIIDRMDSAVKQPSSASAVRESRPGKEEGALLTSKDIKEQVDRLNRDAFSSGEKVMFDYDDKTNRVVVRFIDKESNEVVRQYPAKEIMRLAEHIHDYLGMLIDESR